MIGKFMSGFIAFNPTYANRLNKQGKRKYSTLDWVTIFIPKHFAFGAAPQPIQKMDAGFGPAIGPVAHHESVDDALFVRGFAFQFAIGIEKKGLPIQQTAFVLFFEVVGFIPIPLAAPAQHGAGKRALNPQFVQQAVPLDRISFLNFPRTGYNGNAR
jgi:hypothetical protein